MPDQVACYPTYLVEPLALSFALYSFVLQTTGLLKMLAYKAVLLIDQDD